MKPIHIGSGSTGPVTLNIDALLRTRMLVQANSGGGKSWALRRILEQSYGKAQQVIIDLEGEFSTLREQFDYVLIGKGGEVAADVRIAPMLAERILDLGLSTIIDLYELKHHERIRFVKLFLDAMMNVDKKFWHPCLVVVDEAHQFAPEKGESEALGAVIDLCTRGRKRSFCAILATQRLSKLHKDAAAECNNKLIGRTGLDVDMKRASEELGFTSKENMLSLRTLAPGEFYAFGPALSNIILKTKVGTVQTTHPDIGSKAIAPPPPKEKVKAVLARLADLPKETEERRLTVEGLQAEIRSLRGQLSHRPKAQVDESAISRAMEKARDEGRREMAQKLKALEIIVGKQQSIMKRCAEQLIGSAVDIPKFIPPQPQAIPKPLARPVQQRTRQAADITDGTLTNPELRIINAIAWMEGIGIDDPEQPAVAFLAGYRYGGGAYNNPRGSLRTKGLVEYLGDRIKLTDEGRRYAEPQDAPLTDEQLHQKVLDRLPAPEQRLLKPLLDAYPESLSNDQLAEAANYAVNTGGFNNPRGRLRTLGLIEYLPGSQVRARSLLFPNLREA